jgi:hypothetical protein
MAATTHSAVLASCAPRALHSMTPAGRPPSSRSTPAVSVCTTASRGIRLMASIPGGAGKNGGT